MSDKVFRCRGCGEIDQVVEITLIPSIQTVRPDPAPKHTPYEDVDYTASDVVDFYEGAPVLGYGCRNEQCRFWHGDYGYPRDRAQQPALLIPRAPALVDVAEEVDTDEQDETYRNYRNGEGE